MSIIDPPPAPEGGQHLRGQDLKNRVCIIRPTVLDTVEGKDGKPWTFVACDVWILDRAGIDIHDEGVRISWWKAVEQLKDNIGQLVACKPVEQADNSIELTPLTGEARAVAERVAATITVADDGPVSIRPSAYEDGSEPF